MTGSRRVLWARYGYVLLSGVFSVCVLVQVYIAGMAVFIDPESWEFHRVFVRLFDPLLILLLIVAFLGKFPRSLKAIPIGLLLLVIVQYETASMFGSLVAAIHPVNAVVMFLVAFVGMTRAWLLATGTELTT